MSAVAIDLVKGFFELDPAALELYLDQRQSVDQNRHVVAVLVAALLLHLLRHLKAVLAPLAHVYKFDILVGAVVAREAHLVAQGFGAFVHTTFVQVVQYSVKFAVAERRVVMQL